MLKLILISGLTLSTMTATALAEPMKMTDAQMDKITAGVKPDNIGAGIVTAFQAGATKPGSTALPDAIPIQSPASNSNTSVLVGGGNFATSHQASTNPSNNAFNPGHK